MMRSPRLHALALVALSAIGTLCADSTENAIPTFNKDIAPIFQEHCQNCHRPGEIAPMSLIDFSEARPWAKSIRREVLERRMPPWGADSSGLELLNDKAMSEKEIATVIRWIDGGAPEGDPGDLPPAKSWGDDEWTLGKPDLVFMPEQDFIVPNTENNEDLYQCILLPTNLDEDIWVEAFEYRIDNREIVHHIVGFVDTHGRAAAREAESPEFGFECGMGLRDGIGSLVGIDSMLGGWGPGVPPNVNHPGTAKLIPKGAHLIFQMHFYNRTGEHQTDRSGIGVHLAENGVRAKSRIQPIIVPPFQFRIPAGEANARHTAEWRVPKDVYIYSMAPHMHYLGKGMTFTLIDANGSRETLLSVPRFDFDWQITYRPVEPKFIPQGSTVEMTSVHDNSASNPDNPSNPPIDVSWGESTTEEMSIGFIGYWYADEDLGIPSLN